MPRGGHDDWRGELISKPRGGFEDCYQNVYLTLKHHPEWAGIVAFDEFAGRAVKLRETPCGTEPGEWDAYDDQRFGLWLAQHMSIVIKGDGPVAAGVAMIANAARTRSSVPSRSTWERADSSMPFQQIQVIAMMKGMHA